MKPSKENPKENFDEPFNGSDNEFDDTYEPYSLLQRKDFQRMSSLQLKFYYFFEEPNSIWAKLFSILSLFLTFATTTVICIDSLPNVIPQQHDIYLHICVSGRNYFDSGEMFWILIVVSPETVEPNLGSLEPEFGSLEPN
ncbi:302_t:CDS:2 [Scutellospora calospora]|uniref:302_t:CDS:1 n=1 Tax=Scutellospora calospora TaxID=85575 RepID=A0ACA9M4K2_9GLOM|nr:302_t:CDS:2 [Scutellospora calospora]